MNTPQENFEINHQYKVNRRLSDCAFAHESHGCYAPVSERCKTCLEIFDEDDLMGGLCEFCHNELSNPTQ